MKIDGIARVFNGTYSWKVCVFRSIFIRSLLFLLLTDLHSKRRVTWIIVRSLSSTAPQTENSTNIRGKLMGHIKEIQNLLESIVFLHWILGVTVMNQILSPYLLIPLRKISFRSIFKGDFTITTTTTFSFLETRVAKVTPLKICQYLNKLILPDPR